MIMLETIITRVSQTRSKKRYLTMVNDNNLILQLTYTSTYCSGINTNKSLNLSTSRLMMPNKVFLSRATVKVIITSKRVIFNGVL